MAIVQISKIQQRRGLQQDLPQLGSGEIGWSIDTRRIYIGNGTLDEGAPVEGKTEILTEFSVVDFTNTLQANISSLQSNVTVLQGNIVAINQEIVALQLASTSSNAAVLLSGTTGNIAGITSTNATINYSLTQGSTQRTGTIRVSRSGSIIEYDEDYTQTAPTDITFTLLANTDYGILNYTTISTTQLLYRITTQ